MLLNTSVNYLNRYIHEVNELALPNYKAEYRLRVLAMIYEKNKGKEIVIDTAPRPEARQLIDSWKRTSGAKK